MSEKIRESVLQMDIVGTPTQGEYYAHQQIESEQTASKDPLQDIGKVAIAISDTDTVWRQLGRCRGVNPNIFYPQTEEESTQAKEICAACPVKEPCLEYALTQREKHGVWGGQTERERRKILRLRRAS